MNVFDNNAQHYDAWFDRHKAVYQSELNAIKFVLGNLPPFERALEIGIGTGRFAAPLGIAEGIEPAPAMRTIAKRRGLKVMDAVGEKLPFESNTYDLVLIITTICFVADPQQVCREASRILKPGGSLIVGFVDRDSSLGKKYESHRNESIFYKDARFFSVRDIRELMINAGFKHFQYSQTLLQNRTDIEGVEPAHSGYGQGGFVVIAAQTTHGGMP